MERFGFAEQLARLRALMQRASGPRQAGLVLAVVSLSQRERALWELLLRAHERSQS